MQAEDACIASGTVHDGRSEGAVGTSAGVWGSVWAVPTRALQSACRATEHTEQSTVLLWSVHGQTIAE